jgi:Tfp pilus assembly protein PilF
MARPRHPPQRSLKEIVMRYTPAAIAVSLLAALTSSVGYGAAREPDPRSVALVTEGRGALSSGDVQGAIDRFEAALAIDPAHTAIYLDLAEAARRQGLQGKAIHYYRATLEREPGNLAAISGEGAALVERGAVEKARRNLSRLESLCGTNCEEARQLAAAIQQGPQPTILRAEARGADSIFTN